MAASARRRKARRRSRPISERTRLNMSCPQRQPPERRAGNLDRLVRRQRRQPAAFQVT